MNENSISWPVEDAEFETVTQYHEFSSVVASFEAWVPKNGHRIVLMGIIEGADAANNISLIGEISGQINVSPLTPSEDLGHFDHAGSQPIWVGEKDEKLLIDTSTVAQSYVTLYGHEES